MRTAIYHRKAHAGFALRKVSLAQGSEFIVAGSESGPLVSEWRRAEVWTFIEGGVVHAKPAHSGQYQVVMSGADKVSTMWYDKEHNTWSIGRNVVPVELIACWRGCTIPFCPEG